MPAVVVDIARRADILSHENDPDEVKRGYWGITIPPPPRMPGEPIGGFLEMDPPEQRHYRQALNPYLSPAAVARWLVAHRVSAARLEAYGCGELHPATSAVSEEGRAKNRRVLFTVVDPPPPASGGSQVAPPKGCRKMNVGE